MADIKSADDPAAIRDALVPWYKTLPRKALVFALSVDIALLVLYVLAVAFALHMPNLFFLVNLKDEGNPPSWWFGIQQFLIALSFLLLASRLFASDERIRPLRTLFLVAGIGFTFISADEIGEIHEHGSKMLQKTAIVRGGEKSLMHAVGVSHKINGGGLWLVVYAALGIVLIAWALPQMKKAMTLWREELITVLIGFVIFVFSAAILQVVGYFQPEASLGWFIYVFFEQGIKMVGMTIILYGVAQVLAESLAALTIRMTTPPIA